MYADAAKTLPSSIPTTPDMLGVLDLHFHERHPEKILIQGPGFFFWVTEDYGRTFKAYPTPGEATLGFWMELKVHPNVPEWLLAKVKRKDCLQDLSSAACAHDLMISKASHPEQQSSVACPVSMCYNAPRQCQGCRSGTIRQQQRFLCGLCSLCRPDVCIEEGTSSALLGCSCARLVTSNAASVKLCLIRWLHWPGLPCWCRIMFPPHQVNYCPPFVPAALAELKPSRAVASTLKMFHAEHAKCTIYDLVHIYRPHRIS